MQGGVVNYLCLPHNPSTTGITMAISTQDMSTGAEYGVSSYSSYPFRRNLHNHEAPCVVCFVKSRSSMLMMPARNDCPSGWTEEYHGYLMTSYYNHRNQKDFVCVDKDPEYVPGTNGNKDGALLYFVQGGCSSLPCTPYVLHRELTCAVCTK